MQMGAKHRDGNKETEAPGTDNPSNGMLTRSLTLSNGASAVTTRLQTSSVCAGLVLNGIDVAPVHGEQFVCVCSGWGLRRRTGLVEEGTRKTRSVKKGREFGCGQPKFTSSDLNRHASRAVKTTIRSTPPYVTGCVQHGKLCVAL
jgi:hypothetical protein